MKIVLIGSGNVGTQLGLALKKAGHSILQVYSPDLGHARALAIKLRAEPIVSLKDLSNKADVYLFAVKDDALPSLVKKISRLNTTGKNPAPRFRSKLFLHTSGSLPMSVLKPLSVNYGVLYPVQTLTKNKLVDFTEVPICVEGNTYVNERIIKEIGLGVSKLVVCLNSAKRKQLHLAAVFAGNFSNHMYAIAYRLLKDSRISFKLLLPLIMETAGKVSADDPALIQTGPAVRNDKRVLKMHLKMLNGKKKVKKLYRSISESIQRA